MKRSLMGWYYKQMSETLYYLGFNALVWRTMKTCLSPFGHVGLENFYQRDLARPIGEIRAKVDLTVGLTNEVDIEQLVTLELQGSRPRLWKDRDIRDTILKRLQRGSKCFVGKIENEIVHYNWITFRRMELELLAGRFMELSDDEAFCHSGYTAEAWRGKAIHTSVHNQMLLFLQQKGYRKAFTVSDTENKSSQKTHHRTSWELIGTALYFIPRGAKKAWICRIKGTLAPFVGSKKPEHEL